LKYPKTIQIGGHTISISLVGGHFTDVSTVGAVGDFCRDKNEIRVAIKCLDGTPKHLDFINETLWHEFIEAIKENYGLKIEHDDIDRTAQGILQILNQLNIRLIEEDTNEKV
jgi:hypothetical protein